MSYLPLFTFKNGGKLSIPTAEEELGLIIYSAVVGRAKSLISRKEEKVVNVTYLYYPLLLVNFRDESSLIFDPYSNEPIKFNYIAIDLDHLDKLADETGLIKGRGFLEKLQEVLNVLNYVIDRKAFYREVSVEVKGLIIDNNLLEEIKTIIQLVSEKRDYAVEIEPPKDGFRDFAKLLEETLVETSRFKQRLLTFLNRVKNHYNEWISDVKTNYGELLKNMDEEIERTRLEVGAKINEYESKRVEEESRVKETYERRLKEVDSKIAELEGERRELELELLKIKRTGGDEKSVRNKLKEVEKKLKQYVKLRSDIVKSMEEEIREIKDKYNELIETERRRIIALERRKESINRELEELMNLANDRLREVEKKVNELINHYRSVEEEVSSKRIMVKVKDQQVLFLPICIVVYEKEGRLRDRLITPSSVSRSLLGKSFERLKALGNFMESRLKDLYVKINLSRFIEENNILNKVSRERIELALNSLKSSGVISGKEVESTLRNLGIK